MKSWCSARDELQRMQPCIICYKLKTKGNSNTNFRAKNR